MTRARSLVLPLFLLAAPRVAVAQGSLASSAGETGDRVLRVSAESVTVAVTFMGAGTARLEARTPAGAFVLPADSLTLRRWALAATQLPEPGRDGVGGLLFNGVELGDARVGTSASLARLTASAESDYQLTLVEGERRHVVRLRWPEWESLYYALLAEDPQAERAPAQERVYFAFQVSMPAVASAENRPPVHPPEPALARERASLVVQFVVGSDGRPQLETFRVLRGAAPAFAEAVRRAVATWRYTPATLGGVRVAQLVQMPFEFEPR